MYTLLLMITIWLACGVIIGGIMMLISRNVISVDTTETDMLIEAANKQADCLRREATYVIDSAIDPMEKLQKIEELTLKIHQLKMYAMLKNISKVKTKKEIIKPGQLLHYVLTWPVFFFAVYKLIKNKKQQ